MFNRFLFAQLWRFLVINLEAFKNLSLAKYFANIVSPNKKNV